ncbi:FAD-binding protein [Leptothermofonsia sichuanensis E412]|uniref:FAD-binding protein n=1 Tax=Leptothermofonsia sichuanensis TaxID=2917832 RepID=UPI001CA62D6D|nr:FAD-binding protein [Leptothermofonsia sichuanensis]QZZ20976.1 FAD-binding protein [Leptothermofonsia sichuanensis E412]
MSQNCLPNQTFINWAQNINIRPRCRCTPKNLDDLVAIVQEAQRNGRHVRAVGSGWSFSDVMVTQDYLISLSEHINRPLAFSQGGDRLEGLGNEPQVLTDALTDAVRGSTTKLTHVEAGIKIKALYQTLDKPRGSEGKRWTLKTMGGGSGQTLAGVIATGTHGGDFHLPPIADHVKAIHLVAPDGVQHWIERSGEGRITDRDRLLNVMRGRIRPEHIHYDDEWFNAVLVSMGCMGIAYSYIIEVREQFGLSERKIDTTWNQIKPHLESGAIFTGTSGINWLNDHPRTLDTLSPSGQPQSVTPQPRGISVFINPYRRSDNYTTDPSPDRDVMLMTHATHLEELREVDPDHQGPSPSSNHDLNLLVAGFEAATIGGAREVINRVIRGLRSSEGTKGYPVSYSVLDTTNKQFPILSVEIVVSTDQGRHVRFIDRMLEIFDDLIRNGRPGTKFAGGFNLRYTRPSSAFLAMQHGSSFTSQERFCHIEVIVIKELAVNPFWDNPPHIPEGHTAMENYTEDFVQRFEESLSEFGARLHWGQYSISDRYLPQNYPEFSRWMRIRDELTRDGAIRTFDNDFTARYGIATVTPGWKVLKGMLPTIPTTAPDDYPRQIQSFPPTILRNRTGCLEVFTLGGDGQVCWTRQNSPNNEYLKWKVVSPSPITCTGRIAAVNHLADQRKQPHLFVLGKDDGKIYKAHRGDDPSQEWDWGEFGGPGFVSSPVVAYDQRNQMHVYALHNDGRILRRNQDNKPFIGWGWGNWAELRRPPIRFTGNLAVANNQDKRMEVFARDEAGRIWHSWQLDLSTEPVADKWSQWVQLGSFNGFGDPVAVKNADGRIEIFARRSGEIWHMWQTAPSNGWNNDWVRLENFVSNESTNPDVILAGQRLHMVVLDSIRGVHYLSQSTPNTWQAAIPAFLGTLVGNSFNPPVLGENANGSVEVFAKTAPDIIQHGYVSSVVVNPACKGWVWANQPTATSYIPDQNYQYNSAGGINEIVRLGVGQYKVKLPRLGRSGGMVHVSAYRGNHYCKVANWNFSGNNQFVNVNCFSPNGTPIDGQFVMLFYKGVRQSGSWTDAYLWANQPTTAEYTPDTSYQWNSKGLVNTVRRIGTGHYQATLPGMNVAGGTVLVTAYGTGTERCKVGGWNWSGNSTIVNVYCFNVDGNPVDTRFTLSFMTDVDLGVPEPDGWWSGGYVWADQPTETDYVPATNYQRNTNSNTPNRIKRLSTGAYQVHFPNLSLAHSTAQVTAYGSGSEYCTVQYWGSDGSNGAIVSVQCFDRSGALVDTRFTLMHC